MKLHWPDLTFGPINLLNCPYISLWRDAMKTHHCDECAHHNFLRDEPVCSKGHKPRFYVPRSSLDRDAGWKRKCADFEDQIVLKGVSEQWNQLN